ncbi:hypothetical protein GLOIN_2v1722037 [Rhizophagus irregularis DAOM 181602=DAOM 197198]|nr:hypothetical protein GLOIN_2v1722037 [Rhizophagus irregularis DAOM 181602=DAOM 197198]
MELIRKIYGGYNPIGFTNSNRKYPASDSFIFSFENGEDIQNMKISRLRLSGQLTDGNFEGLDDSRTEFRRSTGSRVKWYQTSGFSQLRDLEFWKTVSVGFRSSEKEEPRFVNSGRLLSSEERKTKIRSGGLLKIRGIKIRSGGFPTNGKREPRFVLRILVRVISD